MLIELYISCSFKPESNEDKSSHKSCLQLSATVTPARAKAAEREKTLDNSQEKFEQVQIRRERGVAQSACFRPNPILFVNSMIYAQHLKHV